MLEHLAELDKADEESKVNRVASVILAEKGESALVRLIAELREKRDNPQDRWRRYWVATILGRMRDPRALDALIAALQDGDIRGGVADAFRDYGDRSALQPLIEVLPQCSGYASIAVKKAIDALRGDE